MKNKKIIICGDSFAVGIGCRDLKTEPFGQLLGNKLNLPVVNLAKGSSTNMSIYLQVKHIVDTLAEIPEFVIVGNTSYDRLDWFRHDHDHYNDISNFHVNYHEYPPYHENSYIQQLDSPMKDNNGNMFTDNLLGVIDYWETYGQHDQKNGYYKRFENEPKERMKLLYDYAISIHHPSINRLHSIGVLTMAHQLLKKANIKHLMISHEPREYEKFMDVENIVDVSWGDLSVEYPDDLPSLHTSAEGHKVAYQIVYKKLLQNGWLNE